MKTNLSLYHDFIILLFLARIQLNPHYSEFPLMKYKYCLVKDLKIKPHS